MDQLRRPDRRRARSTPSSSRSPTCRAGCRASGCTRVLPRRRARARHRGLQLPARRRRRHEHRRRLRDLLVGARVRRHGVRARRAHHPAADPPAGDRDGAVRPGLARPLARGAVAAGDPAAAARPVRRAGLVALAGTELEFIVFDTTYEAAHGRGYRDLTPANQYNVDYSILGTTRVEPLLRDIRNTHVRRRAGRRGRQGRVQLRPARDRLPVRRRADHRRQPRRLQDRRQGDRRPAGQGDHVHGEVRRARGQLLPHPPVAARRRTASWCSGTTTGSADAALRPLRRRRAGHDAPTSRCSTRRTSTPTSGSPTARSRRRRSRGASTTAPAPYASSATAPARGWRTGCPAATSTPTSRWPRCSPAACTASSTSWSSRTSWSATPTRPDEPKVPHTLRGGPRGVRDLASRPGDPRRRGRRPLHQHGRRRAGRLRRGGHRLGAAPRIREDVNVEHDVYTVINPATAHAGGRRTRWPPLADADAAIERAHAAFPAWRRLAPGERAALLRRVRRGRRRPHRRARRARGAQRRPHLGQRALGGRQRPRLPELLLRRARSGCSAGRSRWPAASTSPSTSRSAWSASSCPGTSRCRSPAGASRPRWPPATRSCSSRPS